MSFNLTTTNTTMQLVTVDSQQLQLQEKLQVVADMVLDTVSERTKRDYERALLGNRGPRSASNTTLGFLPWLTMHQAGINRASVNKYIVYLKDTEGVPDSSINQRLAAIRKLAKESAGNGLIDYQTYTSIKEVDNKDKRGEKLGNWLSIAQAEAMINAPAQNTTKGVRDRAILGVMIGAGLRRTEVVNLTVDHLQQRDGRWVILDLISKHNKTRTIPIASWVKALVDRWLTINSIEDGYIFRPVRKGGFVQDRQMSSQAVWDVVQTYSPVEKLAPHDLRRTFAKLAAKAGADLVQVQKVLGHASIQTTQKYVGADLDLQQSPSDFIKLDIAADD